MILRPIYARFPAQTGRAAVAQYRRHGPRVLLEASRVSGAPFHSQGHSQGFPRDASGAPQSFGRWHWSSTNTRGLVCGLTAPLPVGVDAEWCLRPRFESALATFSAAEIGLLGSRERVDVLRLWSAKEAVLKLTHVGVADLRRCPLVERPAEDLLTIEHRDRRYLVRTLLLEEHVLSVARDGDAAPELAPSELPTEEVPA